MSNEQFIDDSYEAPVSGGGYAKIEQGENRFRILSSPLMLWVMWGGGKSTRIRYNKDQKPAMPQGENPSVKHAWAMIVWNYQTSQIEIMELDKATLREPLLAYSKSADWGHPKNYDVVFTKSGSGRENTKYALTAVPPKPVDPSILEALAETPIDLTQLLVEGGNPFIGTANTGAAGTPPPAQSAPPQGNPFPPQEQTPPPPQGNPFPPQTPNKAF